MGFGGDLVALWEVPLSDGIHKVGFEHGTTTGRRVLWVDGQERIRHDWMFKLVGSEVFEIGDTKCVIKIEPIGGFSYEYSLEVCLLSTDFLFVSELVAECIRLSKDFHRADNNNTITSNNNFI
ncbi:hypothetical protein OTU49_009543 [Cherax quadricarinatus]|uniref:Fas apoptotic inhibitory molecule n=1 Tax=Cherax quadricarinatus TaxID=27406 RepID=A0AAW0W9P2_CHEQU